LIQVSANPDQGAQVYSRKAQEDAMSATLPTAECSHCKIRLAAPEWSERADGATVHIWHCPVCGREFETRDEADPRALTDAEAIRDQFANLLVA